MSSKSSKPIPKASRPAVFTSTAFMFWSQEDERAYAGTKDDGVDQPPPEGRAVVGGSVDSQRNAFGSHLPSSQGLLARARFSDEEMEIHADETPLHAPERVRPRPTSSNAPATPSPATHTRYISRAVRRAVAQRDQFCCTFVSNEGIRCSCRSGLEYHHCVPVSHGGATSVDNLVLRCSIHHDHQTLMDFGVAKITAVVSARKASCSALPPSPSPCSSSIVTFCRGSA